MKIQYPILIENGGEDTAWGIIVPDLPGCFSAADNENEILEKAREAILLHLEALDLIPEPSNLESVKKEGFIVSLVDLDLTELEGPSQRINVTVPKMILKRIDIAAKSAGMSRSAFLTDAALKEANR